MTPTKQQSENVNKMKNYIVSINVRFTTVTDIMANNKQEAFEKVKEQITEEKMLHAISDYKIRDGRKGNTLNDVTDLVVTEDYVEEGD